MSKCSLAIVIPTYNRAEMLYENLTLMLPKCLEYNISIYISDDSSDMHTAEMIKNLKIASGYELFFYKKNIPSLGHDLNCFYSLKLPNSDYIWYLGDSVIIEEHAIDKIMAVISGEKNDLPDIISVNCDSKVKLTNGYVNDTLDFLVNTTWYITMTGASIYSRRVIEFSKNLDFKLCYKNFPQLAIILEYCNNYPNARYFWVGDNSIYVNKNKKNSYWSSNAINVFSIDWWNFINHFSSLFDEKQIKFIALSHSKNTSVLGFLNLLKIRSVNGLNRPMLNDHGLAIKCTSKTPFFLIKLIALLPSAFLRFLLSILAIIRG